MASYRFLHCAIFFFLLFFTASSAFSSSVSLNKMLESHSATGQPPLKPCPKDFKHKIYKVMVNNCKRPHYKTEPCCNALRDIACPYVNGLNDVTGDCIIIDSDYHGNYPAADLFAKLCGNGKKVMKC